MVLYHQHHQLESAKTSLNPMLIMVDLKKNYYLSFCFWLHWVIFVAAQRLSLVAEGWGYSVFAMRRLLIAVASPAVERRLEVQSCSSCSTWAQ